ncbi:MAG: DegV family protein [Lachnospiraceae bacterium]|nr:DegV family protein [Lachnospiraceae bacterium]
MESYQIFTDATADLSDSLMEQVPSVEMIPMPVEIGGSEYTYSPVGNISVKKFYELQRNGSFASTSQINPAVYFECFVPYLRQGKDIIYLCFSSGMSGTIQSANLCIEELRQEFPERKIICIDTLCASVGEGFLVREAARKQAEGLTLNELANWVMEHRLQVCHWFTIDTLEHLRHGGRISSAAAAMGTVLQIKPLLHVDEQGCLQVKEKPRGRKRAIAAQLAKMEQGWNPETGKLVLIGHGDNLEAAQQLSMKTAEQFSDAEIYISNIGPIIGAHTGPDMLALIYWGNNR